MDNKDRKLIRKSDIIVIAAVFTVLAACFFFFGSEGEYAVISADGARLDSIPLKEWGGYSYAELPGVTFTVDGDGIRISENDCKDLVCVKTGAISHSGEAIICMPKKISVEVKNNDNTDLDAIIQ